MSPSAPKATSRQPNPSSTGDGSTPVRESCGRFASPPGSIISTRRQRRGSGCGVDRQITRAEYQRRELTRADRQNAAAQTYCHDARIGLFYAMTTSGGCGDDAEITKAEYDRKQLNGGSSQQASALGYCYDPRLRPVLYANPRRPGMRHKRPGISPRLNLIAKRLTPRSKRRSALSIATTQSPTCSTQTTDPKIAGTIAGSPSWNTIDGRLSRRSRDAHDLGRPIVTLRETIFFYRRASPGPCSPHREITAAGIPSQRVGGCPASNSGRRLDLLPRPQAERLLRTNGRGSRVRAERSGGFPGPV